MEKRLTYSQFTLIIESDTKPGGELFAFTIKRADGSVYEDSDFDFESELEALTEAKSVVDEFYK